MAKTRQIQTKFWSDPFIQTLSLEDKLLYLYFLTNEHTNISGAYEITLRTIGFEIGMKEDRLSQAVDRLSQAGKLSFLDNYIVLHNFVKNQTDNPSIRAGIQREMALLPQKVREFIQAGYSLGTASPQAGTYLTKLNLTLTKPNLTGVIQPVGRLAHTFSKPTIQEVSDYCLERNNTVDASKFWDFYESKGWLVGRAKMKDWRACVRTWEKSCQLGQSKTPRNLIFTDPSL